MQSSNLTGGLPDTSKTSGLVGKNIVKSFGHLAVCQSISINVQHGEIVGLLGPNGAGKTTLFNILVGIERPDSGSVFLDNQDVTRFPIHKRAQAGLGYLPQTSTIFRGMNVDDNLLAVLEFMPLNHDERMYRLEKCVERFQLQSLRRRIASSLSGGERRRLEIARTSLLDVTIFLLDEPLAAIDPISVVELHGLLVEMRDHGAGLLISDHNVRETLDIVDRAYVINLGSILFHGRPDELVENPDVRRLYLGEGFRHLSRSKT